MWSSACCCIPATSSATDRWAIFDSLWRQAARAEEVGFDHIWLGDSVTMLDKARGNCFTLMAALAMATKTIGIGSVPMLPSLRNPVLLAHTLATLDVIAKGRIHLGVSAGPVTDYIRRQFEACGVPAGEKAGRLSESIVLLRRLWAEDPFDFEGKYYSFENTGILPRPIQTPAIPIWIAAGDNETALRRVARLGDGWVTTEEDIDEFKRLRALIDGYSEEYGRAPGATSPTMLYATFRVDEDGEKAREEGFDWMVQFFRKPRERLGSYTPIFGTPEECAEILKAYAEAGMSCIVARLASENIEGQMDIMLNRLKPALAAR